MRGSMARIHLLIDELPAYLGFDATDGPQHHGHQMLGASVENFEATWEAERRGGHVDDARTARRQAVGTTARHAGRRPAHLASTRAGLPAVAAPRLRRIATSSLDCRWSLEPSGT